MTKLQQVKQARKTMAKLIMAYGDDYWPLFKRLDEEMHRLEKRQEIIRQALEE